MKKKSHAALFIGCLMASCIIIPIVFLLVSWQTNKMKNTPPQKADLVATEVPASGSPEKNPEDVTENTEAAVFAYHSISSILCSFFHHQSFAFFSYLQTVYNKTDMTSHSLYYHTEYISLA